MGPESPTLTSFKVSPVNSCWTFVCLVYQSFGVVYGDISISPLYVFSSTFVRKLQYHDTEVAVYGVLSLIFWILTLVAILKYSVIVLCADDNGEGGTFALYSLLCRHARVSLLPGQQSVDTDLSTYTRKGQQTYQRSGIKVFIERHRNVRTILLLLVLLGTSMFIAVGVLTPSISVLSSIEGLQVAFSEVPSYLVIIFTCAILVGLFMLQYFGTHQVAVLFSPVVLLWLFSIAAIGIYNIIFWNPSILQALSPYYIYLFFQSTGKEGWISMGGIVLCITGSETMFADLGHFTKSSIRVAFICVVYPCLVLGYIGHAAYLSKNISDIGGSFYASLPSSLFWPVFIIGTAASIVGSQSVISSTFSIIKQCQALNCFPRVKVVQNSRQIMGQIYIPEMNWILMILCLSVTLGFQDSTAIGNAYAFSSVVAMLATTCLIALVMVVVWQTKQTFTVCFFVFFVLMEGLFLSATIVKIPEGGWVSLILGILCMLLMYIWHYGTAKKYDFDFQNKVSMKWIMTLGPSLGIVRVPGIGLIYTELVTGVPAIFSHFVTNLPAFYQIIVFVCIKSVHVPYVPQQERYLVGRIGPREYRMYRCVVRYGYKDVQKEDYEFENQIIIHIGEFIQREAEQSLAQSSIGVPADASRLTVVGTPGLKGMQLVQSVDDSDHPQPLSVSSSKSATLQSFQSVSEIESPQLRRRRVRFELPKSPDIAPVVREEIIELIEAKESGVAYILGHSYVKAKKTSSMLKKFAIDAGYSFLRKNCRGPTVALSIPHICLIEVGMIYHV